MNYVVIETGGKQYKVAQGSVFEVEKLDKKAGETFQFDKVLLMVEDEKTTIGVPYLDSVFVEAKVLENIKGDKIRVTKYKAKSRYRRVYGHRQTLSRILIEKITEKGKQDIKVRKRENTA